MCIIIVQFVLLFSLCDYRISISIRTAEIRSVEGRTTKLGSSLDE